jgi:hypothetical protein
MKGFRGLDVDVNIDVSDLPKFPCEEVIFEGLIGAAHRSLQLM